MGKKSKQNVVEEPQPEEDVEETQESKEPVKLTYEEQVERSIPIARPMASRKLAKKAFKVAKKGLSKKKIILGLKVVQKALRKGETGFVVLAGDTDPMDVISHFPLMCEEKGIPYMWVPSKVGLGNALSKGSAIVALIQSSPEYAELYDEVYQKVKEMPLPI
ncbi:H/ACA ribonucleoprotein complex subunit 2-like protein [Watersipora subatra]|uniref:H/ACA ribonucleoprotein complex subunit 2-like protein n=1 Tax=Watersipora subatra TaxID=2589382 RepID=UPI00355B8A42